MTSPLVQLRAIATQAPPPVTEASLRGFLARQPELAGADFTVLVPEETIAAGASSGLLMFEIVARGPAAPWSGRYVLRYELGSGSFFSQTSLPSQFQVIGALHAHGVPTADVVWLDTDGEIAAGATSLVMRRIDARPPMIQYLQAGMFTEVSDAMRETMMRALMAELVKLHALPIRHLDLSLLGDRGGRQSDFLLNEIDWAVRELHARFPEQEVGPRATLHTTMRQTLTAAAAKLRVTAPRDITPVLVHGDPTIANTMFASDGSVVAILDWELVHAGLAAEDPFYFCYAARSIACLGDVIVPLPEFDDVLRYYREAGGKIEHAAFARALAAFRINVWGAIGMRRMPEPFWPAELKTWETQNGMLTEALTHLT